VEDSATEPVPGTLTDRPAAKAKRSWGMTFAAIGCWFVGSHLVLPVPGVILYLLVKICMEEGWQNILPTPPGRSLMIMIFLSLVSTVTWMTAGWAFFRSKRRRGLIHIMIAVGSGLLSALMIAFT
jgi:hypothetical protein